MRESTREIYCRALLLTERHGLKAPNEALDKAFMLDAKGDGTGAAIWLKIARASMDILDQLAPGATVH